MNNSPYYAHKKRLHRLSSEDLEISSFGLPRKKYISEESFAREMAAMSLDPNIQQQQQYTQSHPTFGSTQQQNNKNVVYIDHLSDDDNDEDEQKLVDGNAMYMDVNGKAIVDSAYLNGLPLELRPGEHKPRIPDFVLEDSRLTDPRDIMAYQNMLKSLKKNQTKHIEVLNDPTTHYAPTSMDID